MRPEPATGTLARTPLRCLAAALGLLLLASRGSAQQVGRAELMDFRAPLENFPPPNEAQAKTLLEGARAEPQANGWFLLTGVKLTTFSTNGTVELLAEAPHCYFDSVHRTVTSAGPLQVKKADGTFILEGEGFLLRQTDFNLIISNKVHTTIQNVPARMSKP
jgi:hypothetical protein